MANKCSICTHSKRLEIDREIVKGGALPKIAKIFGVRYHSLYTHSKEHIARQLSQAWNKKEVEESFNLLSKIDDIITKSERIFDRNYKAKKDGIALKALDSQRNTIQLLANISYSLHQAKLTELEIMKQKAGETDQEQIDQFQDGLKNLNEEELKMLQKLIDKVNNETHEIILPPKAIQSVRRRRRSRTEAITYFETENGRNELEMNIEPETANDTYSDLVVRPLVHDTIPVTPRRRKKRK